jgi:tetratricopeptide (TPR) repeat protein/predicted Ser/Thr protein kinase
MIHRLTCPQGHAWEVEGSAPAAPVCCPVCGALSDTLNESRLPQAPVEALTPETLPEPPRKTRAILGPAIPDCELLEELGRGGAGVVFKAQQPNLGRMVAVKMLVSGVHAGAAERQRFQAEARAAARLQHPNIVRIYQVGEVEDRPYLVMEYLAGGPLSARLRGTPRPAREAAELLRTLARAVHCAHEQGILHRDLKPGNVLLERDGTPKIADFGLAKHFDPEALRREEGAEEKPSDVAGLTETGQVLGTPSYMAPEQARGAIRELKPAADVYALGAILYELLTGRPPFRGVSAMEILLGVLNEEPLPPRRLEPGVPRDLETICLKCLEKRPQARYTSAAELADDLDRFLAGEPIRARPVSRLGRTIKWARRRPAEAALLTVSAVALAIIVGGLIGHQVQLDQKNIELAGALSDTDKQRQRNVNLLRTALQVIEEQGDFADEQLRSLPHTDLVRQQLLERRLRYYDPILAQEPGDAPMRQTQGVAYLALGITNQRLRRYAEAEEAYQKALARFEPAEKEEPTPEHRFQLARALVQWGTLMQAKDRDEEAEQSLRRGYTLLEQLVADHPEPAYRRFFGVAGNNLGRFFDHRKRFEEARETYQQVIRLRRQLADDYPEEDRYLWDLYVSHNNLGGLYLGRFLEAELAIHDATTRARAEELAKQTRQAFDDARTVLDKLAPRHADSVEYRYVLAGLYLNLGILDRERAPAEALKAYRQAVPLWTKLHDDFPAAPEYTQKAADASTQLGLLLEAAGQQAAARDAFRKALAWSEQLERQAPEDPAGRASVNQLLYHLGRNLVLSGQLAEGERLLQRAVERLRDLAAQSIVAKPHFDLAATLDLLADLNKAKASFVVLPLLGTRPHDLGLGFGVLTPVFASQAILRRTAEDYYTCMEETRRAAKADAHHLRYYYSLSEQSQSLYAIAEVLGSYRDMVRATEAAEESARAIIPSNPGGGLRYVLAALYQAHCARLSADADHARQHARDGLRLLTLAVGAGYRNAILLERMPDLEPVRRLCAGDFAKLLAEVKAKK